jgi:Bacterial DNA polymerase III alpha NTPase domain
LAKLIWAGARERHPDGVPSEVATILKHELSLIDWLQYAPYFLAANAIVRFAGSRGILCRGRDQPPANSAVCCILGITLIDPVRNDLLFERFISEERRRTARYRCRFWARVARDVGLDPPILVWASGLGTEVVQVVPVFGQTKPEL